MSKLDLAELTSPVSNNDPCGPDLELAGNVEFMNFMARADGLLPVSFFSGPEGKPFDRSSIHLDDELASAKPFLGQTRDIRLLVLLAKFCLIGRDLDGFVKFVSAIAALLEQQWAGVHPRAIEGDFGIRLATLETLDDSAPVVFPLQYQPLIESRRLGSIGYRQFMFASGEAQPREGEESHDRTALEKAAVEMDLPNLLERRRQFETLRAALIAIRKSCADRLGAAGTPNLEKLSDLSGKIFTLLNGIAAKIDPSAAVAAPDTAETESETGVPAASAPCKIKSRNEAAAALRAAGAYFARFEPSNPALLLIQQAQQLMGKSLLEVLQILMPSKVEEAKFLIGKDQALQIPIERLAQFASGSEPADGPNGPACPVADDGTCAVSNAESRQEAFALLEQVVGFYRAAEPSSPVANILERARGLAERDFGMLLKEIFSAPT